MVAAAAYFELPAQLRVTESCLGKRFATFIGGHRVTLVTPVVEWKGDRPAVVAPDSRVADSSLISHMAEHHKDGWEKWDAWGSIGEWNLTTRVVTEVALSSVLLEFSLNSQTLIYSDYLHGRGRPGGAEVEALFSGVDGWFENFRTWIEVAVDQDADPQSPIRGVSVPGEGLQIVTVEGPVSSLPASASLISVFVDQSERLNLKTLRRILAKLRTLTAPGDAHLLLRDARADFRRGRLRKAVIDAGSAVELTLADANAKGPKVNTGPRPTLGWFVDQPAISTFASLPPSTKTDLVGVRNDAIHSNVVPSVTAAQLALELARSIVNRVDPLGI